MHRFARCAAVILPLLLCCSLLSAQNAPKPTAPAAKAVSTTPAAAPVPKLEFEKYSLPNGLQVILHVDRKLPVVHVNAWYHVGSKNERFGRTGFAHLFEHMMFTGSVNAKEKYLAMMEKAGANLFQGGVNGTTDQDRTNYFETVPAGSLEYVLWAESDRLATLADSVDQAKLDNQRDVVKNERRQGLENQPYGRAYTLITENVFPSGHPYSWDVIGVHADLTAASLDDVKEFFHRFYTPNNLSLVIAGDFDPGDAKRLVEKYFGGIPAGPALDRPKRWVPLLAADKVVDVRDRVPQERVYIAWPTPQYFSKEDAELDLASLILSSGLGSRLQKVLVHDKQLCTNVNAFEASGEIAGTFIVSATARPGAKLSDIEQVIGDELAKLAKAGPTAEELKRAQTKQEYQFVTGLQRIGGFGGKADILNRYNTFVGDPGLIGEDLARYRTVTPAALQATVQKYLNAPGRVVVRFHPEMSTRSKPVALDRAAIPALGGDKMFHAPEVQTAKLKNGLEVYAVPRSELPLVSVMLVTKAGAVADPRDKLGVALLHMRSLDKGTAKLNALQIADQLGDLGANLIKPMDREYSAVGVQVLKRNLSPTMALIADLVHNPTFPADEVEREKKKQLDRIAQEMKDPNSISMKVAAALTFGPDHPYGAPMGGRIATINNITAADLKAFHQKYWTPANSAFIVSGDVSLDEATKLAEKYFGGWTGQAPPAIEIPAPQPAAEGSVFLVDRQDAAQTVVLQALSAPPRKTDDYYNLRLADAVWGGGFSTRLNLNLREDKGYSYGTFSFLNLYSKAGTWAALGGVQTNKTRESVVEFMKELDGMSGKRPITEKELADARANRVRGYAQQFESNDDLALQITQLWAAGLPMSELQREAELTQGATLDAVNAAAHKYVVPQKAMTVLVGDRAKIEPGLRDLNLGNVVVLDPEGKPVEGASAGQSK